MELQVTVTHPLTTLAKRVLITGGAGFIGSHIADAIIQRGAECLILDDLSSGRRENVPAGATFVQGDICDELVLARVFADFRPDVVCHQAAQASVSVSVREPVRDADVNVVGTLRLLDMCVRSGVKRFVFASTGGAIYGEVPEGTRAKIATPPAPLSPYACSKLAVEHYLRCFEHLHGIQSIVLRYANVYGPRQDPHGEAGVVAIFTERILSGKPVRIYARKMEGDDGCVRDYTHVSDVVRANLTAIFGEEPARCTNVCTGVATTTLALALAIEKASGMRAEIGFGPMRIGDVERSVLEPLPSATPVSLADGLTETVTWFFANAAAR